MMTALGRLCMNFLIPSTNSCFDSSSANTFRNYGDELNLHSNSVELTCQRYEMVEVDDGK